MSEQPAKPAALTALLRLLAGCGLLCALSLWVGCDSCKQAPPPLATLVAVQDGKVERDFAARVHAWQGAPVGETFALGDGVRTDTAASARLALIDQTQLELAPGTTVRFLVDGSQDGETAVNVETGQVMLRAGSRDLALRTHIGLAQLSAGSSLKLTREANHMQLAVAVGEARFRDAQGQNRTMKAGDLLDVGIGMAVLGSKAKPLVEPEPEPLRQQAPAAEPLNGSEPSGREGTIIESLPYANLATRAGESFTVHAPELPAAVRFEFPGKCPNQGVIELRAKRLRARGKDAVSLHVPKGEHAYVLYCPNDKGALGKPIARGTVQVVQDAGTRSLPPKAPTSQVETDGRTYTIYYQNQPPEISVRWPNPPTASSYQLTVDGKTMTLSSPTYWFRSGSLRDGLHEISFQAGARKSRTTSVQVAFDNAAPKASLSSPTDRSFKPGDPVTIEGVALETWKVSIAGGEVTMDANRRFKGTITTSPERPDIAVRLAHPRRGVHYYLRRAAGSP